MEIDQAHFEQYKLLRGEIASHTEEIRKLEVYGVVSVAAFFGWLSVNPKVTFTAWFIAAIIPLLLGIRVNAQVERIKQIAEYLRDIEAVIFEKEETLKGWERIFKERYSKGTLTGTSRLFWSVLFIITLVAPFSLKQ